MPERITPAKRYKDDKARDEVLKYERRIILRDILTATKNGIATTADIKAAAKRLGIERRKAERSTGSNQSKKGAKPKAKQNRFGNVEDISLYLRPDMNINNSEANINALMKWYESRTKDIILSSAISKIDFSVVNEEGEYLLKVDIKYTENELGFELAYIKLLLTYELGSDNLYRVRVASGNITDHNGKLTNVKTSIVTWYLAED